MENRKKLVLMVVLKKAAVILCNILGAVLITCLYLIKAIEQAYLQRGYVAYGGEYLMVPFVFWGAYKLLSLSFRVCNMARRRRKEVLNAKCKGS